MQIKITTDDRLAEFALFEVDTIESGVTAVTLAADVRITCHGALLRKGVNFPHVVDLIVGFGGGVGSSLVASAIWEWLKAGLKANPISIEIDREVIAFEEGEVTRVIREKYRQSGGLD